MPKRIDPLKTQAGDAPAPKRKTNAKAAHFPSQIDREFASLMEFVKTRDIEQVKEAVKINLLHFKNRDEPNYTATINYYNQYKLWGAISPEDGVYELVDNRAEALSEHRQDFEWLYGRLGDYRSKRVLLNILWYWLSSDFQKIDQIQDKAYDAYFDLDLIRCDGNEVFVDIGAYIGDTMVNYVKVFGTECYKKIYCYEIVPANLAYVNKNIEMFNLKNVVVRAKGASDQSGALFLSEDVVSSISKLAQDGAIEVPTVTIDDDIHEKVTFIKMDIEGGEEAALRGCQKKIKRWHPKLALAAYHNHKDLYKLACIIDQADSSYRFYLRYYGGMLLPTEYVLYAI